MDYKPILIKWRGFVLTHGGSGQGLTANKLCRPHASQEITELASRRQMDAIEIQAAKEIGWGKSLFQAFTMTQQLNSLKLIGYMHETKSSLYALRSH